MAQLQLISVDVCAFMDRCCVLLGLCEQNFVLNVRPTLLVFEKHFLRVLLTGHSYRGPLNFGHV